MHRFVLTLCCPSRRLVAGRSLPSCGSYIKTKAGRSESSQATLVSAASPFPPEKMMPAQRVGQGVSPRGGLMELPGVPAALGSCRVHGVEESSCVATLAPIISLPIEMTCFSAALHNAGSRGIQPPGRLISTSSPPKTQTGKRRKSNERRSGPSSSSTNPTCPITNTYPLFSHSFPTFSHGFSWRPDSRCVRQAEREPVTVRQLTTWKLTA